ncbi:MAG: hypothetical protein KDE33_10320 [Bacteroidetes bacterium]|nr:hypothetical protein [Bacteroidota bacterium]
MIKIEDIFVMDETMPEYSKAALAELDLKKDFIDKMNQDLGLTYVEGGNKSGNLCYQNTPELQAEYKITFSKLDVINYLCAVLNIDIFCVEKDAVLFPKDGATFWKSVLYIIPLLFICLTGCNTKNREETALLNMFHKEKELSCQLASMKDSITLEWDNINGLLEENLPADMPLEEKNNMLKVRNASLIRMFQSFDEVDEEVKKALDKTEKVDMEMSKRITALKREVQKIESEKMMLFQKINETMGAEEVARFKDKRQSVLAEKCK